MVQLKFIWTISLIFLQVSISEPKFVSILKKGVEEKVIDFVCPNANGKFPHPVYCEQYYQCKNLIPTLINCQRTHGVAYLFNADSVSVFGCDYAYAVHCYDRIRPEGVSGTQKPPPATTTTTATTTRPSTTTLTTKTTTLTNTQRTTPFITLPTTMPSDSYNCTYNGAFPHSKYCDMYFDCWEGTSTLLKCPNDTLFEVQYSGCVPPMEVDCGSRTRPGFKCPVNGEDGAKYPDSQDCSAYYTCSNSSPIHQFCPVGLYFNQFLSVCDFPSNVDCTDRERYS